MWPSASLTFREPSSSAILTWKPGRQAWTCLKKVSGMLKRSVQLSSKAGAGTATYVNAKSRLDAGTLQVAAGRRNRSIQAITGLRGPTPNLEARLLGARELPSPAARESPVKPRAPGMTADAEDATGIAALLGAVPMATPGAASSV